MPQPTIQAQRIIALGMLRQAMAASIVVLQNMIKMCAAVNSLPESDASYESGMQQILALDALLDSMQNDFERYQFQLDVLQEYVNYQMGRETKDILTFAEKQAIRAELDPPTDFLNDLMKAAKAFNTKICDKVRHAIKQCVRNSESSSSTSGRWGDCLKHFIKVRESTGSATSTYQEYIAKIDMRHAALTKLEQELMPQPKPDPEIQPKPKTETETQPQPDQPPTPMASALMLSFSQVNAKYSAGGLCNSLERIADSAHTISGRTFDIPGVGKLSIGPGVPSLLTFGHTTSTVLEHVPTLSLAPDHHTTLRGVYRISGNCARKLDRFMDDKVAVTFFDCFRAAQLVQYLTLLNYLRKTLGEKEGDERFNLLFKDVGGLIFSNNNFLEELGDESQNGLRRLVSTVPLPLAYLFTKPNMGTSSFDEITLTYFHGHPEYGKKHGLLGHMGGHFVFKQKSGPVENTEKVYLAPGLGDEPLSLAELIIIFQNEFDKPPVILKDAEKYTPPNEINCPEMGHQVSSYCFNKQIIERMLQSKEEIKIIAAELRRFEKFQICLIRAANSKLQKIARHASQKNIIPQLENVNVLFGEKGKQQQPVPLSGLVNIVRGDISVLEFESIILKLEALSCLPATCDADTTQDAKILLDEVIEYFRHMQQFVDIATTSVGDRLIFLCAIVANSTSDLLEKIDLGDGLNSHSYYFGPTPEIQHEKFKALLKNIEYFYLALNDIFANPNAQIIFSKPNDWKRLSKLLMPVIKNMGSTVVHLQSKQPGAASAISSIPQLLSPALGLSLSSAINPGSPPLASSSACHNEEMSLNNKKS